MEQQSIICYKGIDPEIHFAAALRSAGPRRLGITHSGQEQLGPPLHRRFINEAVLPATALPEAQFSSHAPPRPKNLSSSCSLADELRSDSRANSLRRCCSRTGSMGLLCSRLLPDHNADAPSRSNSSPSNHAMYSPAALSQRHANDMAAARRLVNVLDDEIAALDRGVSAALIAPEHCDASIALPPNANTVDYLDIRRQLVESERKLDFDYACRTAATPLERRADAVVQYLKLRDCAGVYDCAAPRQGHGGQLHPRFPGDHFLSNVPLIEQTALLDVARKMPKGAHLHIHFNACLLPHVLLEIAKGMERMFITSNIPLTPDDDYVSFDKCEIQFSILAPEKEQPGDLFSPNYQPRQTMRFREFLERYPRHFSRAPSPEQWLMDKLVFQEKEAHDVLQTASGAWEKFNGRTRMMKGLFNYETAYRRYTRLCLEDFLKDNIQYAEIRPNFMTSNQLYYDDGSGPIDNWGIMKIIIAEVQKFQADMRKQGRYFGGLKVIYCTPRSFKPSDVRAALKECIEFKKQWPQWIAGFDLVGEEAKGRPIKDFISELLEFRSMCDAEGLDIPFLFHCGETLDMGTDTDGNVIDALLLNSRRIGHGFALVKHPYIMQQMKARNICLEICPISNEILGLTPRASGHAMYQLLANKVHCTVNSDNGTLFRSSLSHDFYQVMVGRSDMSLYGWKQLVLWSMEHSCLSDDERTDMMQRWESSWIQFLEWVVETYDVDESKL
ncbi:Adenosine deaminase 2 [Paramyrothecium foliicola]|nr:Adenosine deaminase 2 [Paramyrothecium foliicola]